MDQLLKFASKEKYFLLIILFLGILCLLSFPYPNVAMWLGFMLAGYSAVANDSIQTIGTFISSNSHKKWYYLWIFMGVIWVGTVVYSWVMYDGDVTYQRLATKGFTEAPTSFTFGQIAAPLILLILTRLRMPVSTSILLLSIFSTKASSIGSILEKSFFGYVLAFGIAFIIWVSIWTFLKNVWKKSKPAKYWDVFQWITSGALWSVWIMQDAANIAVYLPRKLGTGEFVFFVGYVFLGLGLLFFLKGDKIQGIVNEKTEVTDVRSATIIDFVYACLLFYLKVVNTIPISTTWVFIGLLGGRELAISFHAKHKIEKKKNFWSAFTLIKKDIAAAGIGLVVSLVLAILINDPMRVEFFRWMDANF